MFLDSFINDAFNSITNKQSFVKKNISLLNPIKYFLFENTLENLVVQIHQKDFSGLVAGVDSGFVSKKISVADIVLIKLSGVLFEFKSSKLVNTIYYPAPVSFPEPILLKSFLENNEETQSISLERLKKEISLSINLIKKFKPRFLFIDGSIVPQYQDKPNPDSSISSDYNSIINLFQQLYVTAEKNDCVLISTIEDSRGKRFIQLLEELLKQKPLGSQVSLSNLSDSILLDGFLKKGERTLCFQYASNYSTHPVLKDYAVEWSKNIFVFYLKPSDFDFPLRVEFISKNNPVELASEIASIVYQLSSIHKEYAFPSILIEADLRARLSDNDISIVYNKLIDKLGPKIKLRRNSRPF